MLAPGFVVVALSLSLTPPATPVSLIQLVATPERYDGKPVKVTGLLSIRPSAVYLFPGAESRRYFLTEGAIAIDTQRTPETLAELDNRWVTLAGEFHARAGGGIVVGVSKLSPAVDYESSPMPSPYDWRAAVIAVLTALLLLGVLALLALRLRRR